MKQKKIVSCLTALLLVMVLTASSSASTAVAASGNKKVTSSGKMTIILTTGQTGNSSVLSLVVSGLPTDAIITRLDVNTGSLDSYNGAMLTNSLTITGTNGRSETIAWAGATNKTFTTSQFLMAQANATYTISFNCTCLGGAVVNGIITDTGTKTYSKPYIVVYWDQI